MRTIKGLNIINDVNKLVYFLYMDSNNNVIFSNTLTNLKLKMDEQFHFKVKNLSYPEFGYYNADDICTVDYLATVVELLKETTSYKSFFNNRWEEIEFIVKSSNRVLKTM